MHAGTQTQTFHILKLATCHLSKAVRKFQNIFDTQNTELRPRRSWKVQGPKKSTEKI